MIARLWCWLMGQHQMIWRQTVAEPIEVWLGVCAVCTRYEYRVGQRP